MKIQRLFYSSLINCLPENSKMKTINIALNTLIEKPKKINFSVRSIVAREQTLSLLYQPYLWWGQYKHKSRGGDPQECFVSPDTEIVIDGFQGSANSFATLAFQTSQTKPIKLAHHLHSPAQIIQATKWKIPILLTIRDPMNTILSLTSRWPYISVTQGLQSFIGFYSKLKPYSSCYIVSSFDQTTQHLDQVIHRLNIKFNTQFDLVHTAQAKIHCQAKVSDNSTRASIRQALKEKKKQEFLLSRNSEILENATALYQSFTELIEIV
jgi:hypothetical protein